MAESVLELSKSDCSICISVQVNSTKKQLDKTTALTQEKPVETQK